MASNQSVISFTFLLLFIENFSQVKFNVEISFFEIYNEKIHDLLGSLYGKDKSHKRPTVSSILFKYVLVSTIVLFHH